MSDVLTAAQYQTLAKADKKPRRNDEYALHKAIVHYLHQVMPWNLAFHPANGERRDMKTAVRLKAMGVRPGVPDLVIPYGAGRMLWLEIKAPGGRASKAQREYINKLRNYGHTVAIVQSVEDVRLALSALSIVTRETGK